ncbi:molybdenum ABC transporter ATP-binding protein [Marinicella sediminis]|uniref:Molybdenum ABC transporter ATP-binding protein n=1 Tax=Marinicella sediminis TaxID=1792834 RepID=A0ABV7J954_9GAMM|nr:molybdenum ABC transporter ATP-binding protein [Marinicella sediminis]
MTDPGNCQVRIDHGGFHLAVDLSLPVDRVLGVWGPSGCGKTSLLRTLAGLDKHPGSVVIIGDQVCQSQRVFLPAEQRALAYVFQDQQLFPHLTVRKNLEYAWQRRLVDRYIVSVDEAIAVFDLAGLLNRYPRHLSGGEQQRVALARGLLRQPGLMLLDEPMASLDHQNKARLLPYLRLINQRYRLPMLYVSHQLDELMAVVDDLLVIREGRPAFNGELNAAMIDQAAGLSTLPQAGTVLAGAVVGQDLEHGLVQIKSRGGLSLWVKGEQAIGTAIRMIIAANEVSLSLKPPEQSSVLNVIQATVVEVIPTGSFDYLIAVCSAQDQLVARISGRSLANLNVRAGQSVFAQFKTQAIDPFE